MSISRRIRGRLGPALFRAEDILSTVILALTALLPCIQVVARIFARPGIRDSFAYIQHLVLWVAFAGGSITAREEQHLALTVGFERLPQRVRPAVKTGVSTVSVLFSTILFFSSLSFALQAFPGEMAGVFPIWLLALVMPAGFALITARLIHRAGAGAASRLIALAGIIIGLLLSAQPLANLASTIASGLHGGAAEAANGAAGALGAVSDRITSTMGILTPILLAVLIASILLGSPIFVLLGGLATIFFLRSGGSLEVIPNQAYTILAKNPVISTLPMFTLAGYIISESRAGERLVRLFRALFGWLPGGFTLMSVLICAFLTTFTGASGITIVAVGALLFYILSKDGYRESFSTGLLTASGSIGLLFPPSLPVILFGVVAQVDIRQMFVGGFLPGVFMVLALSAMGVYRSVRDKVPRIPFRLKEALSSIPGAALEILLPVLILVFFFTGIMTLVETAAFSVVYAFVIEVMIHRDLPWKRIPEVFVKSVVVMGGVLLIIALANGLQYYTIDANVPTILANWLHNVVSSKYLFLLLLNLALLLVGCFMDIYSATTVIAPLILPIAAAYGINSVHLGIIFLANLELGYLTPPVGLNLYLASYRFEKPLSRIVRSIWPFLIVMLAAVLVITYFPPLTTALLGVFHF
jgi:C4-dicarboxylate transporter DctM subunit